jgi:anti-sigma B factor antagonist
MNLTVSVDEGNARHINVSLSGEIDAYTAPKLKDSLVPASEITGTKMTVDLSEVSYMDSTGLGVFVGIFKTLRANDGDLQLVGLSDRLQRLFEITGLSEIMNINTEVEGE